jgi:putative ABC transport system permease protein
MWDLTLRNLSFRRRQFLVAVAGTALVFAMAILVGGMSAGFSAEAARTLNGIGGNGWVVPAGTPGPFDSLTPFADTVVADVSARPGVHLADPIIVVPEYVLRKGHFVIINVIGHRIGGLGEAPPVAGRRAAGPGEVVMDKATGFRLGESLSVAGHHLTVVGLSSGRTFNAGQGTAYVSLADAQAILFAGRPLVTGIIVQGVPAGVPAGMVYLSRASVQSAMLRPLINAEKSINNTRIMLWIVAVAIVAGVMYVAALERIRDFAVLKAVGAQSRSLVMGLVAEAVIVALFSAAAAVLLARLLRPTMKGMPIQFTTTAQVSTVIVAVAVGVLASISGVRRALRTDPALAFGGGA